MAQRSFAVGADMRTELVDAVIADLRGRGFETDIDAPSGDETTPWPTVAERVAHKVRAGTCHQGILFCWTGTGVCMAANKVPGIRAALCRDSETAAGARKWNDANVLVMSLRATTPAIGKEIVDAWLAAEPDPSEADNVADLARLEATARKSS